MIEEWRNVFGFDGYMVSNLGRLRSHRYKYAKKPRIMLQSTTPEGYKRVSLEKTMNVRNNLVRIKKNMFVHRVVAQAFIKKNDNKDFVNHRDMDKENNTVSNLEWVSSQENMDHLIKNNGNVLPPPAGNRDKYSKLDDIKCLVLKTMHLSGFTRKYISELANKNYGISKGSVTSVLQSLSWKHLKLNQIPPLQEADKSFLQ